jgi:hypothetical protein
VGIAIDPVGDLDGNGHADFVVSRSAGYDREGGASYLVLGAPARP